MQIISQVLESFQPAPPPPRVHRPARPRFTWTATTGHGCCQHITTIGCLPRRIRPECYHLLQMVRPILDPFFFAEFTTFFVNILLLLKGVSLRWKTFQTGDSARQSNYHATFFFKSQQNYAFESHYRDGGAPAPPAASGENQYSNLVPKPKRANFETTSCSQFCSDCKFFLHVSQLVEYYYPVWRILSV